MMIVQHGGKLDSRVVDHFEAKDLGAPFKVVLHNAVKVSFEVETGSVVSYTIPDLDGLLKVIVMNRVLHQQKFSGDDIRFIRKAINVKQKDLAKSIEITPEHLSRYESGAAPITPASEKLLRVYALKTAFKLHKLKACDEKTKLEDALDKIFEGMTPLAVYDVSKPLELHFRRSRPVSEQPGDDGDGGPWNGDMAEAA